MGLAWELKGVIIYWINNFFLTAFKKVTVLRVFFVNFIFALVARTFSGRAILISWNEEYAGNISYYIQYSARPADEKKIKEKDRRRSPQNVML